MSSSYLHAKRVHSYRLWQPQSSRQWWSQIDWDHPELKGNLPM